MDSTQTSLWHILDVGSIWMKEFGHALAKVETVAAWSPRMERLGLFRSRQQLEVLPDPGLNILRFPLQRGYARSPLRWMMPFQAGVAKRLLAQTARPTESPLICSTPFYAPVAELWPGPVIYYSTDLTIEYEGVDPEQVNALDRRLCRVARAVCPNSQRIANYFISEASCERSKITIIPNATRESNVLPAPQYRAGPLPSDVADLPRPIVGVLGDLSANMDWELLQEAIEGTPDFSWLFVGPYDRPIANAAQRQARDWATRHARFVGMKPYGELQGYARCFDVAVLPYKRREPTYSGSSTRFYEHLAAGRPMVATRGFAELLEKQPLLTLGDTARQMTSALERLRSREFLDGHEVARWQASRQGTWEERVRTMRRAIAPFLSPVEELSKQRSRPLS